MPQDQLQRYDQGIQALSKATSIGADQRSLLQQLVDMMTQGAFSPEPGPVDVLAAAVPFSKVGRLFHGLPDPLVGRTIRPSGESSLLGRSVHATENLRHALRFARTPRGAVHEPSILEVSPVGKGKFLDLQDGTDIQAFRAANPDVDWDSVFFRDPRTGKLLPAIEDLNEDQVARAGFDGVKYYDDWMLGGPRFPTGGWSYSFNDPLKMEIVRQIMLRKRP